MLEHKGLLKERKCIVKDIREPRWKTFLNEKIANLRRKIAYINLIIEARKKLMGLTKRQRNIQDTLKRWYGNTKNEILASKLATTKHELKVMSAKLRNKTTVAKRNSINRTNQKKVFRNMKSEQIKVSESPNKEELKEFWGGIWGRETTYNHNAPWPKTLARDYCKETTDKQYVVTVDIFKEVLSKMKNNSAPGNDLIRCYWIKKLTSTHNTLVSTFYSAFNDEIHIPNWLANGISLLFPKTTETKQSKNYRPIACQNITYKLYTGILNKFLTDHCETNEIVTTEQAGGKPGSWGCIDQLLINKIIMDEVSQE